MGAPRKADWREERRKRAWNLKEQGWQQKDSAVALGVSEGAVSQWLKRGRAGGIEALSAHPPKGVAPRLTAEQKAQIPHLLAKGAYACPEVTLGTAEKLSNGKRVLLPIVIKDFSQELDLPIGVVSSGLYHLMWHGKLCTDLRSLIFVDGAPLPRTLVWLPVKEG